MAEDPLRSAIDAITRRVHEELETQLAALRSGHAEEVEAARRTTEAEAEQRWFAKVDDVRAEWTARLESEVAAARSEAERRMVAESMRLRAEVEQAAAESESKVRAELEETLAREREQAQAELAAHSRQAAAAREQLQTEIQQVRDQLQAAREEMETLGVTRQEIEAALDDERRAREADARQQEEKTAAATEAQAAERQAQLAVVERLLAAIRSLDTAQSLSQVLSELLTAASAEAPRVALFVVNGQELKGWKAEGFGIDGATLQTEADGMLAEVLRRAEPVTASEAAGPAAPAFADLPPDRAAIAVPLLVGGQPVALLYADDAREGEVAAPASWPEAIQILCCHASVNLAHLTAARAADAMRRSLAPPVNVGQGGGARGASPAEDGNSARRYARLLVSEIKLYNEAAVQIGRQKRDLLARLKPEIERARRLYQQRISSDIDSRGTVFQQELVQTLADGDPALLGGSA